MLREQLAWILMFLNKFSSSNHKMVIDVEIKGKRHKFCTHAWSAPIYYWLRKQSFVALSSYETDYIAIIMDACQIVRTLFEDLKITLRKIYF